jgi:hypothetical protein
VTRGDDSSPPDPPLRLPEVGEKAKSTYCEVILVEKVTVYAPAPTAVMVIVDPLTVAVTGDCGELRPLASVAARDADVEVLPQKALALKSPTVMVKVPVSQTV